MKTIIATSFFLLFSVINYAQETNETDFGHIDLHFRQFNMYTLTSPFFQNSYASVYGGQLGYHSNEFKHFSVGLSGSFVLKITSSDLTSVDYLSGRTPRWEPQLLDVENPDNHDIDGLEKLFIQYKTNDILFRYGRINIESPLINPHDGRMRPNALEGAYFELNKFKKIKFNLGYFYKTSPRSTTKWESIEDAIGLFGQGYNEDGTKSGYHGNLTSNGIYYFKVDYSISKDEFLEVYNYTIQNILNTSLIQFHKTSNKLSFDVQYLYQNGLGNGGNDNDSLTYVNKNHQADLVTLGVGYEIENFKIIAQYNRVSKLGRYVFSRELGFDKVAGNISRYRIEGLGNVNMYAVQVNYISDEIPLTIKNKLSVLPNTNVDNFKYNKYNLPSSGQYNFELKYGFENRLKGLELFFFYLYNFPLEDVTKRPDLEYDITNYHQFNLVLNYKFKAKIKK